MASLVGAIRGMVGGNADQAKPFDEIPGPSYEESWRQSFDESGSCKLNEIYAQMFQKYGLLVKEMVSPDRAILHVFDADDMRTVYSSEGKRPLRPSHTALARYREENPQIYSSAGLISNDGDSWSRLRQMFASTIMSKAHVTKMNGVMEDVTEQLIQRIEAQLVDNTCEVDITPLVFKWSLDSIGVITMNVRFGCLSVEGNEDGMNMLSAAKDIHNYVYLTENFPENEDYYKELVKAQQKLESIVQKYLTKAIAEPEELGDSFMPEFIKISAGCKKDIFTVVLDMFTGGTDTVSVALIFMLYNLAKNIPLQDKLREELLNQLPSKTCRVSNEANFDKKFILQVFRESLRMHPTGIGNGRIIPKDIVLRGYKVPAGTTILLQHQVASKQEEYFSNPHIFDPDRWETKGSLPSMAISSFGNGKRKCIGFVVAEEEICIAVARIIRSFEVTYNYDEEVTTTNRLVNIPEGPVRLRFTALPN